MVEFIYKNGKRRKMTPVQAAILQKAGAGRIASDLPTYQTRAMTPDPVEDPAEEISPRTGKPKRKYRRRDMQAES